MLQPRHSCGRGWYEKHGGRLNAVLRTMDGESSGSPPSVPTDPSGFSLELQAAIRRAKRFAGEARQARRDVGIPVAEAPLFSEAREAVQFAAALNGSPARPLASRMVDTVSGQYELSGYDAVAQAGLIFDVLSPLGPLAIAVLVASSAPRSEPCECRRPCCIGHKPNPDWRQAMDTICQAAAVHVDATYAVRWQLLTKIYVGKLTLKDIAKEFTLDEHAVSRHHKAICRWLRGSKSKDGVTLEGLETAAWNDADILLRECGLVGDET